MAVHLSLAITSPDSTLEPSGPQPGDLVDYHGSLRDDYGRYVVVDAAAACETRRDGRLVLVFWPDGDTVLTDVHPNSMTSVGERVPLCTCGLPTAMHRPVDSGFRALIVQNRCLTVHPEG